ncbi:C-type mannose receptor 2-like isoform X2 [Pagrus major]|uniref:C-type mannose receptor 2-like isoform X2 n=1 Tax=Pagrus major TaxID=143350 RepID=UPI003CC8C267
MDAVLLLIMAASGLSAVSSHVPRQYHVVSDLKNMTEAQRYCREKYTDLATIDNMEDARILIDMATKSKVSNFFWIGLYDDVNSWRWSLSDTSFYKDGETEFRQWWTGEPDNVNSREHCTRMYDDGRWYDFDCKTRLQPVCMDVRGLNVTFVLIKTPMTWTEAQSYCRDHHTDLASVRNTAENQEVKDVIPSGQRAWIGLFRDSWKWLDGSNSSFRYWDQDEPNNHDGVIEDCVIAELPTSGKWWDIPCGLKKPSVCYSLPAVQTTSSSSSTSSSTSSTTSSTTQPDADVLLCLVGILVIVVIILGLVLTIICIRRKLKPDDWAL